MTWSQIFSLIVSHLLSIIQYFCFGVMLTEISISSFSSNGVTDLTKCHILNDFEDHTVILKCFLTLIQIILMKFF